MDAALPGVLAVWLALVANVISGLAFLLVASGKRTLDTLAVRSYRVFSLLTAFAVVYLFYLFFTHNYAFKYVYEYNESTQPFFYVLSGFWGGQEGTYLLWLFLNVLGGYVLLKRAGSYRPYAMAVLSIVNLFLLVILVKLSPFALLSNPAPDGLGLNPLLRDPWMVIHPPVMFLGYAAAALPFCIALAALFKNDYSEWLQRAFPWVAVSALFLGAGNILGGYWAYKTLGWGGYWGWDPVENSSLVPWVVSLALLHGMTIERRGGALRRSNLLLTAFLFLLVVYGTFLTRSGVLADFSVHSFVDLGTNVYLVGFMILFVVLTLAAYVPRALKIQSLPLDYGFFGREFSKLTGLLVLLAFGLVILFWSSLPILSSIFSDEPRAADIATYNSFALPLAVLMAFLLAIAPHLSHAPYSLPGFRSKALVAVVVAGVIGFGLLYISPEAGVAFAALFTLVAAGTFLYALKPDLRIALWPALAVFVLTTVIAVIVGVRDYLFLLFFATAAMAAVSNAIFVLRLLPGRWKLAGAQVTHFGFGLMLLGVMASSAFDRSERVVISKGASARANMFGIDVEYQGMVNDIEVANNELMLSVGDASNSVDIRPQLYYSRRLDGVMRKPAILRSLFSDMYLAPEQVKPAVASDLLQLSKGESRTFGDIEVFFAGFEMGTHGEESGNGVRVAALLNFRYGEEVVEASPAVVHRQDAMGHAVLDNLPASLMVGERQIEVTIDRIIADQGMVSLLIPELMATGQEESLVLSISKKPLINLVWAGTTLILLGSILVFIRRREELRLADR